MADETDELLGKIELLFGKRAGFAPRTPEVADEFPMLTEVVAEGSWMVSLPPADALSSPPGAIAKAGKAEAETDGDAGPLAAALERRLAVLFADQLADIESLVRRIVREELDARRD